MVFCSYYPSSIYPNINLICHMIYFCEVSIIYTLDKLLIMMVKLSIYLQYAVNFIIYAASDGHYRQVEFLNFDINNQYFWKTNAMVYLFKTTSNLKM